MNRNIKVALPCKPCRAKRFITSLMKNVIRLDSLPAGSFNAGMVKYNDGYIMVYRPTENQFVACYLDAKFNVSGEFPLLLEDCADPRLIWVDDKVWMVWSAIDKIRGRYPGCHAEHIKGGLLWDKEFIQPQGIRISPPGERQKNWMPFISDGKFFLIGTVKPHTIYEWDMKSHAEMKYKTDWMAPWFYDEFFRGNTQPVLLESGNWLGTFHTVKQFGQCHWYDNGVYTFSGKPPFNVLSCSNRSYLRAEDAIEKHYRKKDIIKVCFPVGMVREGERLLVSYGDNDSCVKILDTTVREMLGTTLPL